MSVYIVKTRPIIEQSLYLIDKFIKAASISAYKKQIQNVGVVSLRYSLNISQNNIKHFIFANPGKATRLLVPILLHNRVVLAVFYWADTRVEYYDSLKQDLCEQFHAVKDAVEKFLGIKFNMTNQKVIYDSINDNSMPLLANVHICRIAEDLCFLQRYQKFEIFNINFEAKRIKWILDIVSEKIWNGEWPETSRDKQVETTIDNVINSLTTVYSPSTSASTPTSAPITSISASSTPTSRIDVAYIPTTSASTSTRASTSVSTPNNENDVIVEKVVVCGVPIILQNMINKEKQINSTINNVVENVNRRFESEPSTSTNQPIEILMINGVAQTDDQRNLNMSEIMTIYDSKYPILSQMLKFYSNLLKLRNTTYKDVDLAVTFQKNFNWKLYSDLNTFEKNKGAAMLKEFPYFSELSHVDKSFLLHRFWTPFWFFERICDTLISFGDTPNGNMIMLQDKSVYDLDALIKDNNFGNRSEWKGVENLVFGYWISVLKKMKDLKPDIIEIMYIFCCILWNISFLNVNLSQDGEDTVRRGRLLIHNEMREFYEYDDEKWNRIYILRDILLLTETSVKEYKKSFIVK